MDLSRFNQLIDAYQARVRLAVSLFKAHRGISDLMDWRRQGLSRMGFIDVEQQFEYAFHGAGCRVETPEGPIDWDFGDNGRVDGFDLWRLSVFVQSTPEAFPEFEDGAVLGQAFTAAVQSGIIRKDPKEQVPHLYYRVSA
ncbi:hypothetical protein [Geothrix sp. PMB-07]|uniref:DUF6896 domain-containing protein n=1 Tax=Geothrix sp. PMB-07 TaxID=3068640 RepID=UPI002740A988|nr:hypothetical protein [Geothrix sp. PMB-07]WLT32336.1 hypothetical protein Q9293_03180 [Geothrix sp. PMB-07]